MKKLILSLIVIVSFLMGNVSMIASIVKIFGTDALLPVVKDLVDVKVQRLLWGPTPPRRPVGITSYQMQQGIARERRPQGVDNTIGGPILKPPAGFPRQHDEGYGYGPH